MRLLSSPGPSEKTDHASEINASVNRAAANGRWKKSTGCQCLKELFTLGNGCPLDGRSSKDVSRALHGAGAGGWGVGGVQNNNTVEATIQETVGKISNFVQSLKLNRAV